jgi:tRNA threonylcarbamoyl adenosine modification protein YeaZ
VAVLDGAGGVHERVQHDGRRTDAWVGLAVMDCLQDAGLGVAELHGLACAVGPGAFTGIRVGIATALGLAAPRSLPVADIRTLDALAHIGLRSAAAVAACIDARRGQLYAALYERDDDHLAVPLPTVWGPAVCSPEDLVAELASRSSEPLVIGNGAALLGVRSDGHDAGPPLAAAVGELAIRAWGGRAEKPAGWPPPEPVYLRPPDATPPENPLLRAHR